MSQPCLKRLMPERNRLKAQGSGFRFHRLLLAPTHFGDWSLVRELRRIGRPGTFRTEPFETEEEAVAASGKKAHEEQRRGRR